MIINPVKSNRVTFYVMLVISILILLGLGWFAWHVYASYELVARVVDRDTRLVQLREKIRYLDELESYVSKLATTTGDMEYIKLHGEISDDLKDAVDEALSLVPLHIRGKVKLKAYPTKLKLQELEQKALELVEAGKLDAADNLMLSEEYLRRKEAHTRSLEEGLKMLDTYLRQVGETIQQERDQAVIQVWIVAALMALLFAGILSTLAYQIVTHRRLAITHRELEDSYGRLDMLYQELKETQSQLIQSEKMAALGQLIAGIAHEVNTPLGVIRASISNITDALNDSIRQLPELFRVLTSEQQNLFFALLDRAQDKPPGLSAREERKLKRKLIADLEERNLEKADEIGETLADIGLYHDLDVFMPLLTIGHTDMILRAAYDLVVQRENGQNIMLAVERASKVVFALKSYARHDHAGARIPADIRENVELVLTLYHNQLKQGIDVQREFEEIPTILCYPDELNQVWTNLVHNAVQAMNGKGELRIGIGQRDGFIAVNFTDSGSGISPETLERIFEPFFTTKPAGEGSGLGLHIVKKIVDKHQGHIEVASEPGKTTFQVLLPVNLGEE